MVTIDQLRALASRILEKGFQKTLTFIPPVRMRQKGMGLVLAVSYAELKYTTDGWKIQLSSPDCENPCWDLLSDVEVIGQLSSHP
jgi:hypothetical protein